MSRARLETEMRKGTLFSVTQCEIALTFQHKVFFLYNPQTLLAMSGQRFSLASCLLEQSNGLLTWVALSWWGKKKKFKYEIILTISGIFCNWRNRDWELILVNFCFSCPSLVLSFLSHNKCIICALCEPALPLFISSAVIKYPWCSPNASWPQVELKLDIYNSVHTSVDSNRRSQCSRVIS